MDLITLVFVTFIVIVIIGMILIPILIYYKTHKEDLAVEFATKFGCWSVLILIPIFLVVMYKAAVVDYKAATQKTNRVIQAVETEGYTLYVDGQETDYHYVDIYRYHVTFDEDAKVIKLSD